MILTGIDASRHQGIINWPQVAGAGHSFAFIKATDGVAYKYVNWYHQNINQVKAAGLVPGAYHFLLDHHPGDAQARYYVQEVNRSGGFNGVVPVVDIEREADGTTPRIEHLRAFVAEFRRLVPGRPILIYTGRWYWVGVIGNPPGSDLGPLWHSEYDGLTPIDPDVANGPELDNYGGWTECLVWQHTSSGSCPGVAGRCDLNLFYGTEADLAALAGGVPAPDPPEDDDMHKPYILAHPAGPHYYVCGPLVVFLTNGQTRVDYQDAKFDFVTVESETDAAAILEAHRNWPLAPAAPPADEG